MLYPQNIEVKLGFDKIRQILAEECVSSLGRSFVDKIKFSDRFDLIKKMIDQTAEFRLILQLESSFPNQNYLDVIPYLKRAAIEGAYLDQEEFFEIKLSLTTIQQIFHFFKNKPEEIYPQLKKLTDNALPEHNKEGWSNLIGQINLIIDENNTAWLTFGSFWEGMKQVKLTEDLTSVAQPEQWSTVARRPRDFTAPDSSAGNAAIEGPFIFKKENFYYLFVSWDYCCRGERSDYKVVVGRSPKATGPFVDKDGVDLAKNGGTLIVQGDNKEWYGAGHNSAYTFDGKDYMVYHGYDAKDRGRSKLIIDEIKWEGGWPAITVKN